VCMAAFPNFFLFHGGTPEITFFNTKRLLVSNGVTPNWQIKISTSCTRRFDIFRDISKYLCIAQFLAECLRCSAEPWLGITGLSGDLF
jgi:hypothetical protein